MERVGSFRLGSEEEDLVHPGVVAREFADVLVPAPWSSYIGPYVVGVDNSSSTEPTCRWGVIVWVCL